MSCKVNFWGIKSKCPQTLAFFKNKPWDNSTVYMLYTPYRFCPVALQLNLCLFLYSNTVLFTKFNNWFLESVNFFKIIDDYEINYFTLNSVKIIISSLLLFAKWNKKAKARQPQASQDSLIEEQTWAQLPVWKNDFNLHNIWLPCGSMQGVRTHTHTYKLPAMPDMLEHSQQSLPSLPAQHSGLDCAWVTPQNQQRQCNTPRRRQPDHYERLK